MNNWVFPTMRRLVEALEESNRATKYITDTFQNAEYEASQQFNV